MLVWRSIFLCVQNEVGVFGAKPPTMGYFTGCRYSAHTGLLMAVMRTCVPVYEKCAIISAGKRSGICRFSYATCHYFGN